MAGGLPSTPKRRKVRLRSHDVRMWVHPGEKDAALEKLKEARDSQRTWSRKSWLKKAHAVMRESFHLERHGGRRVARPVASETADDAPPSQVAPEEAQVARPVASGSRKRPLDDESDSTRGVDEVVAAGTENSVEPVAGPAHWPVALEHGKSSPTAQYHASGAAAVMLPTIEPAKGIPFVPQPVANWLYQVSARAIVVLQSLLGTRGCFQSDGTFIDLAREPAQWRLV